jgi:thiol-disulfide isomerase/thioredoxin
MLQSMIRYAAMLSVLAAIATPAMAEPDPAVAQGIISAIRSGAQAGSPVPFERQMNQVAGASEQQQYEARVFFAVLSGDAAYYDTIEQTRPETWDNGQSLIFESDQAVDAAEQFILALKAREAGDMDGFKTHVQEAVWLDPQMGAYMQAIQAHHEQQRLANLRLPMDMQIPDADGEMVTLASLVDGKKAIYIQVWASWCGPCMMLMPELHRRGEVLTAQGVVVAGMNSEMQEGNTGGDRDLAVATRQKHGIESPWLLEPRDMPFTGPLRVESVPFGMLLAPDGQVLFAGHPREPKLEAALNALGATLEPEAASPAS